MLDAAERAALVEMVRTAAKAEILPRFRNLGADAVRSKSAADDLVTEADIGAEKAIHAAVIEAFPSATVIGEEAVAADASLLQGISGAEMGVIIDPIDGTWNYAKGLSLFGVILAVTHRGETVYGMLYDPINDDWIWAQKGEGAYHEWPDGRRIRLTSGSDETTAEEMAGYISLYLFPKDHQVRLASQFPDFSRVNSLRCSCHEYRMLAQGHAHFGLSGMLNPWDHAAGVLIYQEAGGHAALIDGRDYAPTLHQGRILVARDKALWEALRDRFGFITA